MLANSVSEMGADRIVFSVDWPFESAEEGYALFDKAQMGEVDRGDGGATKGSLR
jgi:2,3-dihydroxybenzoate decarboxylase